LQVPQIHSSHRKLGGTPDFLTISRTIRIPHSRSVAPFIGFRAAVKWNCETVEVSSSHQTRTVDLFDDPPWPDTPVVRSASRRSVADFALAACMVGSLGVAASTVLPWYGLDENTATWVWNLQGGRNAFGPALGISALSPGAGFWGLLILGLSCVLAAAAGIAIILFQRKQGPAVGRSGLLIVGVAILSVATIIAVVLEAHARPPLGDGPPLRFDWGAVVGFLAAAVSLIGAITALFVCTRSAVVAE
jgi:hypothetical protein